jgi:hypothetical protein
VEWQAALPSEISLFDPVANNKFFRSQFFFQNFDKLDVFFDAFSSFFCYVYDCNILTKHLNIIYITINSTTLGANSVSES